MSKVGEDDDKEMDSDIEAVGRLGGRVMSKSIRNGICVCVVVVVVKREVVVVRIVMWVMMVRVSCIRVLGLVGVLYIGALEVNCVGVAGILVLGGVFVV